MPTPLANALAQYAPPQQTPSTPLANALMEYASRVKSDFSHGLDESAQGFGEMMNGQFATGVPRTFLGGLGWMGSPVSGAVSPLLNPIMQPIAQGVHDYVGKPLENATGYPADLTTELALALALPKALHGAGKVVNHSVPYLASLGDAVGSKIGAPEGSYMSGPGPKSPISSPVGGGSGKVVSMKYPMADKSEWYGDANYQSTGRRLVEMTPDEYLSKVRPLKIDDVSRENIDLLKEHIQSGKTLDPLQISKAGKEDGRHRAYAAKELGIKTVPVIVW